jgi:hypothetical protein
MELRLTLARQQPHPDAVRFTLHRYVTGQGYVGQDLEFDRRLGAEGMARTVAGFLREYLRLVCR